MASVLVFEFLRREMNNFDKVIAIDVGLSGGIAVWGNSGVGCSKMPVLETKKGTKKVRETDIKDLARILREQKEGYNPIVFLEKVQGWLSDSDSNQGKRFRIQKMLANYEALKTAIIMSDIPLVEVIPRTWQTYLGLSIKGMEKEARKKMYIKAAGEYYPDQKVANWNGDALCILQFGRMKLQFDFEWVKQRAGILDNKQGSIL